MNARHREVREIAESARKQGLLNVPGDVEFLLKSLSLAFAFDQARIIQNAGRFRSQSVQDLAIELGKGGGGARIEVDDAEKMPAPGWNGGIRGIGSRHGIQRNGDDSAKRLRHDA